MISKITLTFFLIALGSFSSLVKALKTEIVAYDSADSYYRYFVTKKLLVDSQAKFCQVLTYPSFGTPSVYLVGKDKELSKPFVVQRMFQNDKLWHEFSKKIVDEKKDYFDDSSVISVLEQLNTDVLQKRVEISEEQSKIFNQRCEELTLSDSVEIPPSFDGTTTYVTFYVQNGYKVNMFEDPKFEKLILLKKQFSNLFK